MIRLKHGIIKPLQKTLYSLSRSKIFILICILAIFITINTSLHLLDTLLDWHLLNKATLFNKDKDSQFLMQYRDNIMNRDARDELCYEPMDIVYTWVNGSDPYHQHLVEYFTADLDDDFEEDDESLLKRRFRKREDLKFMSQGEFWRYYNEEQRRREQEERIEEILNHMNRVPAQIGAGGEEPSASASNSSETDSSSSSHRQDNGVNRFRDNDELRFSLRSLERFAPWVRNIYIVTSGQVPTWLDISNPRVHIVQHSDIFLNTSHLPVFSSPAIENNLHRIPGLSKRFIYLNDDVFFGNKVYPEDFFSKSTGQNVFLSWDVPDCAPGCSAQWIGDGYCDVACNNTMCDWDGGDCFGKAPRTSSYNSYSSGTGSYSSSWFQNQQKTAAKQCNAKCPNGWVGDKFCDKPCNVPECGYDAGDCGVEDMRKDLLHFDIKRDTSEIIVPYGTKAFYLNMSSIFPLGPKDTPGVQQPATTIGKIETGSHDNPDAIRTSTISQSYKILTMTLHHNVSNQTVGVSVSGNDAQGEKVDLQFTIYILPNVTSRNTDAPALEGGEGAIVSDSSAATGGDFIREDDHVIEDAAPLHAVNTGPPLRSTSADDGILPTPSYSHSIEVDEARVDPVDLQHDNILGDSMFETLTQATDLPKQHNTPLEREIPVERIHEAKSNQIRSPFSTDNAEELQEESVTKSIFSSVHGPGAAVDTKAAEEKPVVGGTLLTTDGTPVTEDDRTPTPSPTEATTPAAASSSVESAEGSVLRPTDAEDVPAAPKPQMQNSPVSTKTPPPHIRRPSIFDEEFDDEDDEEDDEEDYNPDSFRNLDMRRLRDLFSEDEGQPTEEQLRRALQKLQQNHINRRLLSVGSSMRVTEHEEDESEAMISPTPKHSTRDDYLEKLHTLEEQNKRQVTQDRLEEQRMDPELLSDMHPARLHHSSPSRRKLMDMFGDSLVHVDKLLNKKFGRVSRKVPAHMPHMIDKDIMQRVYDTWPREFNTTSSNRFRSSNDMQYTFSYFYFMMHEGKEYKAQEFYRKVLDRNGDGALQDYEVRYLAVVMDKKKISIDAVKSLADRFNSTIADDAATEETSTSTSTPPTTTNTTTPESSTNTTSATMTSFGGGFGSSYFSSSYSYGSGSMWSSGKSEEEVFQEYYEAVREQLYRALSFSNTSLPNYTSFIESGLSGLIGPKLNFTENANPYQLKGSDEIGFHMIRDDELKVLKTLDGLRYKNPKFICLNDDMNKTRPNPLVLEALHDFYTWYFPEPSQFELPPHRLNPPHMYIDELKLYYRTQKLLRWGQYIVMVLGVVGFVVYICYRRNWLMFWNDRRAPLLVTHREHTKKG